MNNLVRVLDKEVERIIYKDQPVVTLRQVDELHQKQHGSAWQAFKRYRDRFQEETDFFDVPHDEWSSLVATSCRYQRFGGMPTVSPKGGHRGSMIFLTQSGYLKVTKPFTDERAWQVQDALIKCYFVVQALEEGKRDPAPDIISVDKDFYIRLLESRVKSLERPKIIRKEPTPLTDEDVTRICALKSQGYKQIEIAKKTGRPRSTVCYVLRFRSLVPLREQ